MAGSSGVWKNAIRIGAESRSLLFIQIFARNIILGHLVGVDFPCIGIVGVFHALEYLRLEGVSFFEQLVDTLRIRTFDGGNFL